MAYRATDAEFSPARGNEAISPFARNQRITARQDAKECLNGPSSNATDRADGFDRVPGHSKQMTKDDSSVPPVPPRGTASPT
jgi:hypothetical protein